MTDKTEQIQTEMEQAFNKAQTLALDMIRSRQEIKAVPCGHAILKRRLNDAEFRFMSSYVAGLRPYECECGELFWVKPLSIQVKTFVPQDPVVVHGPIPDKLPQFEGIDYPIGGKPKE